MELTGEEKLNEVREYALKELRELRSTTYFDAYVNGKIKAYSNILDIIDELNDEREW